MTDAPLHASDRSRILVLSSSYVAVTRLRVAIARTGSLECACVSTVARGREVLDQGRIAALVIEPEDALGGSTVALVRHARACDSRCRVVALLRRAAGWTDSAMSLLAERPAHVASVEELDEDAILRVIAPDKEGEALLAAAWPRLSGVVPSPLHLVVRAALAGASAPLPVPELARTLGMHRKTLWQRCRRAGVASPQVLLTWCRLVAASHALRTRADSVECIANRLEFASATALRNATRRYLGATPSEVRERGGEAMACRAFGEWLGRAAWRDDGDGK